MYTLSRISSCAVSVECPFWYTESQTDIYSSWLTQADEDADVSPRVFQGPSRWLTNCIRACSSRAMSGQAQPSLVVAVPVPACISTETFQSASMGWQVGDDWRESFGACLQ